MGGRGRKTFEHAKKKKRFSRGSVLLRQARPAPNRGSASESNRSEKRSKKEKTQKGATWRKEKHL